MSDCYPKDVEQEALGKLKPTPGSSLPKSQPISPTGVKTLKQNTTATPPMGKSQKG